MNEESVQPICQLYRLYENAPLPRRADPSADGMIPTRGFRYCVTSSMASAFGWYLHAPLDFALMWNGRSIIWTYEGAKDWFPLRTAQYPGFRLSFRQNAPERLKLLAPTCLAASRENAMVQIWTGYVAQTSPRWALHARPPVNIDRSQDYQQFEGIFHTEIWRCGPLIVNIKLKEKNSPIVFSKQYPLVQLQPLPRECYYNPSYQVGEYADMTGDDWASYEKIATANTDLGRKPGHHAIEVRKLLRSEIRDGAQNNSEQSGCPFHTQGSHVDAAA
jgi:hypothetical protein